MVDFRRWILAIAVLAVFAGLASAQVNSSSAGTGALQCNATVAVPPQLRSEGLTELIGDIVLTCTGGSALAPGSIVPTANITVSLATNVTSRLLGNSTGNASEALLLIDEPGSTTTGGAGPSFPQNLCSSPTVGAGPGGCVQAVGTTGAALGQTQTCADAAIGTTCTTFSAAKNVFQGLVNANQVTFNGVPINPPVSAGTARVFRITNIRANVAGLGGGGLAGTTQLVASIAISGSTSLPINNPVQIAGFVQSGLSTSVRKTTNESGFSAAALGQCSSKDKAQLAILRFTENFGTAFKTRVAPTLSYNGQAGAGAIQNVPGNIYNSESGFISSIGPSNNGNIAGLADYGTRLKAVFNVPNGVRIFVSTTNFSSDLTSGTPVAPPAGTSTTSFAQLVISETAPDANGFPPVVSSTTTVSAGATVPLAELPVVNGSATAVWEVINTNPAQLENFNFGVWISYTANPGSNTPTPGAGTVTMSYAPTAPAFSDSDGGKASSTLTIPRFVNNSTATNLLSITICQTVLLYPFVTNQGGFDTGLAIANTTTDPFGTKTQAGTCDMNFYGAAAPSGKVTTPNIPTGTVYATLTSTAAAGFQGYMIAVCNFQLAHGFAFISDLGARNLAMGYLALVLPTGSGVRDAGKLSDTVGMGQAVEGVAH